LSFSFVVSSPGRADFLNTHQDYKGLPVVPIAINLRMYLSAELSHNRNITVKSHNLKNLNEPSIDSFEIGRNPIIGNKFFGDYLRGIVNILVKKNLSKKLKGLNVYIKSEIPVGSGLSSSAALEVGFIYLLNHAFKLGLTNKDLAEVSYLAENQEVGIPCGRLDQYGVTFGGIIKLDCRSPFNVEKLPFNDITLVIIDSGIRHSTADIHPMRQDDINRGLKTLMENKNMPQSLRRKLGIRFDEPVWEQITEEELEKFLDRLDDKARKCILFTIRMHKLTMFALRILRFEIVNDKKIKEHLGIEKLKTIKRKLKSEGNHLILGEVMNNQHALLRDLYDVSLPEIEKICSAALEAGSYGTKISGAGLGGSIIALVGNEKEGKKVIDACLSAGAKKGWVSRVGEGVRLERYLST
jgi:galactokinase